MRLAPAAERLDGGEPIWVSGGWEDKVGVNVPAVFRGTPMTDSAAVAVAPLIDEDGTAANVKRNAMLPLKAGLHPISLRYNHRGGESNFRFRWGLKGQGLRQAYGAEFVH